MAIEMQSIINGLLEGSIRTVGREPVINELNVSENGTYTTPSNIDGYNPVIVNVPIPILDEITITSNGTYTPATELEGYNKINVNVPLPDNAYILNTGSGASVSYNNGVVLNLQNLEVNIEPVQSGSGDPSPTNVRPISGHTAANIVVSPTEDAEEGTTYSIQFKDGDNPLTVYGGSLDVVSGELVVDRVKVDLGTLNWSYTSSSGRSLFTSNDITEYKHTGTNDIAVNAICECFTNVAMNTTFANGQMGMDGYEINHRIIICDNRYTDATAFKTAMNGVQLVYELASPQIIQLTPTQIETLLGNNVITADTGYINNIEYFTK